MNTVFVLMCLYSQFVTSSITDITVRMHKRDRQSQPEVSQKKKKKTRTNTKSNKQTKIFSSVGLL